MSSYPPNELMQQHSPDTSPLQRHAMQQQHHNNTSSGNKHSDLSGFDLLSDQPLTIAGVSDDLVGNFLRDDALFGVGNGGTNNCGLSGLDLTSSTAAAITSSQSLSNNLSSLLTSSANSPAAGGGLDPLVQSMPAPQYNTQKPLSFDYLYEFSETRKVLEEFFTCQTSNDKLLEKLSDFNDGSDNGGGYDNVLNLGGPQSDEIIVTNHHNNYINNPSGIVVGGSGEDLTNNATTNGSINASYIGHRLAKFPPADMDYNQLNNQHHRRVHDDIYEHHDIELFLDSGSRSSGELADTEVEHNVDGHTRNFTLSPETTDYDSNCGDLDSEVSLRYTGMGGEFGKFFCAYYNLTPHYV